MTRAQNQRVCAGEFGTDKGNENFLAGGKGSTSVCDEDAMVPAIVKSIGNNLGVRPPFRADAACPIGVDAALDKFPPAQQKFRNWG